jgi:putative flippase GtrA
VTKALDFPHLAHVAALGAILFWFPVPAGLLLLLSTIEPSHADAGSLRMQLRIRDHVDLVLDAVFAGALALCLVVGTPGHALPHDDWLRLALPLALGGAGLLFSKKPESQGLPDPVILARGLFGVGLFLMPLAELASGVKAWGWALTAITAWAVVHALRLGRRLLVCIDPRGVVHDNRMILLGKGSAVRTATTALTATGLDFSVFSTLVFMAVCEPPIATFVGAASGGIVNFTLNRKWTFNASGSNKTMVRRYVTVSAASAFFNATLVAALLWIPNQHVTIAWAVARALVFLGWNYPLHRDYVFGHDGRSQRAA